MHRPKKPLTHRGFAPARACTTIFAVALVKNRISKIRTAKYEVTPNSLPRPRHIVGHNKRYLSGSEKVGFIVEVLSSTDQKSTSHGATTPARVCVIKSLPRLDL